MANKWGWMGVHFFFVVSGMLMVEHVVCQQPEVCYDPGKASLQYAMHKFKGLAIPYYITFLFNFIIYVYTYGVECGSFSRSFQEILIKSIPELLVIEMCGIRPAGINSVTWYISAMLLAMLPLYYLLLQNRSFFLHIFSPLAALGILSYFYGSETPFYPQNTTGTLISGGFLRACCGICFGAVSWLLTDWLRHHIHTGKQKCAAACAEVLTDILFIWLWLLQTMNSRILFPALLLIPIVTAFCFSGCSVFAGIFRFQCFRYCSSLSLAIFLNHIAARRIIEEFPIFQALTSQEKLWSMAGLTVGFSLLYYGMLHGAAALKRIDSFKKQRSTLL